MALDVIVDECFPHFQVVSSLWMERILLLSFRYKLNHSLYNSHFLFVPILTFQCIMSLGLLCFKKKELTQVKKSQFHILVLQFVSGASGERDLCCYIESNYIWRPFNFFPEGFFSFCLFSFSIDNSAQISF